MDECQCIKSFLTLSLDGVGGQLHVPHRFTPYEKYSGIPEAMACWDTGSVISVWKLALMVRRPQHVHTFTDESLKVRQMASTVRRSNHVHTFIDASLKVRQMALTVRRPQHVHTFTDESLKVRQMALTVRRSNHVHTFTYKSFAT